MRSGLSRIVFCKKKEKEKEKEKKPHNCRIMSGNSTRKRRIGSNEIRIVSNCVLYF